MEVYPLSDGPPPRYAVESDDEDEYNPLPSSRSRADQSLEVTVEFRSIYDIPSKRPLVFASGNAGLVWAKIANLGEQRAGIYVNKLPVGLLFLPTWTNAVIVVSEIETRTRLPLFAMTTYTKAVIEHLQPTSVAALDSYATQSYISPQVIPQDRSPARYLATGKKPVSDPELELFAPPNLLQSTPASLLNELFLRSIREDGAQDETTQAIILLPSYKVPLPPPMFDTKGIAGDLSESDWDRKVLESAHRWLFAIIGEQVEGSSLQSRAELGARPSISIATSKTRAGLGEVGEGSMYI